MKRADGRPRVHLWPTAEGWQWSMGPTAARRDAPGPLHALKDAVIHAGGFQPMVIIVEPLL